MQPSIQKGAISDLAVVTLSDLLGPSFIRYDINNSRSVTTIVHYTNALVKSKIKVIGLYFAAHTDVRCRVFIPKLQNAHKQWQHYGYPIEIVYIPIKDQKTRKYDWLSTRYDPDVLQRLKVHFKLDFNKNIPILIFVNHYAEILDANGIIGVTNDNPSELAEQLLQIEQLSVVQRRQKNARIIRQRAIEDHRTSIEERLHEADESKQSGCLSLWNLVSPKRFWKSKLIPVDTADTEGQSLWGSEEYMIQNDDMVEQEDIVR